MKTMVSKYLNRKPFRDEMLDILYDVYIDRGEFARAKLVPIVRRMVDMENHEKKLRGENDPRR